MTQLVEPELTPAGEELLTRADVCAWLKISPRTLDRIVARGDLEPLRAGYQPRFQRPDVEAYLCRRERAKRRSAVRAVTEPSALYLRLAEYVRSTGWAQMDEVVTATIERHEQRSGETLTPAERESLAAILEEIRVREWGES